MHSKPILCFYIGYTPDYTTAQVGIYGSELATQKLSELFVTKYEVFIFGFSFPDKQVNGVNFRNARELNQFGKENPIDIMIISRYLNYFLEFNVKPRKTYLWLHDVLLHPYWNSMPLPNNGKHLLHNVLHHIDGIVCLSECHKSYVSKTLDIPPEMIHIIGNGIDLSLLKPVEKVKNRFIYISNPRRGLMTLISHFSHIRNLLPDAELYVYRGLEEFDHYMLEHIKKFPYVKFMGKKENKDLIPEIQKAEYWYYPTEFFETYCISALEAQMCGCICICSNIGALPETVECGKIIHQKADSAEFLRQALEHINMLDKNPQEKTKISNLSREWSLRQTWENRMQQWLSLF